MSETLVNTSTEQLVPDSEISPESSENTSDTATPDPTPPDTTAISSAEEEFRRLPHRIRLQVLPDLQYRSPTEPAPLKIQLYSDSSSEDDEDGYKQVFVESPLPSPEEEGHYSTPQSLIDVSILNKSVPPPVDPESGPIPAERNPVSDLLRSPNSFTDENTPAIFRHSNRDSLFCHSVPDLALTEFYSRAGVEYPEVKMKTKKPKKKNALAKLKNYKSTIDLPSYALPKVGSSSKKPKDDKVVKKTKDDSVPKAVKKPKDESLPKAVKKPKDDSLPKAVKKPKAGNDLKQPQTSKSPRQPKAGNDPKQPKSEGSSSTKKPKAKGTRKRKTDREPHVAPGTESNLEDRFPTRFRTVIDSSASDDEIIVGETLEMFSYRHIYSSSHLPLEEPEELPVEEIPVEEIPAEELSARGLAHRRSLKRLNSIKELMDTEDSYNRDLIILCNHYLKCIKETDCISKQDAELLIRNAPQILDFEERFLIALQKAHGREKVEKNGIVYEGNLKNIAKCFIKWGPEFEIYLDYCVRHDLAVQRYKELLQENAEFTGLIERLHTFHRISFGFNKLKFDDYLITPFQRIFRYKLLLDGITKALDKKASDEEYKLLTEAQDIMHNIASKINRHKSKMEAERKTNLFLSRLETYWCLPQRWFSTLGCCSLIGTLEVRLSHGKIKRYGCALFNHYMIMAKAKKHEQYEPRLWFPLRMFSLIEFHTSQNCSFLLHNEHHSLELTALCETERQIWIENLRDAIKTSKDAYTSNTNDYVVEQFFVSSFDQHSQQKPSVIEANAPVHLPLPSGSMSFSQSAIFHKPNKANNRASHPVYSAQDALDNAKSPGIVPQSSFGDLKEFFSINVSEWTGRKSMDARWKAVDGKFDDVCSTPILTARMNSMNKSRKASYAQKPSMDYGRNSTASSLLSSSTAILSEDQSSNQSSRRPSMNIVAQRQPSLRRTTEPTAAGLLPPSSSTLSLSGRSSRFFGKVVEKLSQLSTPSRHRKNTMKPPTFQNIEPTSSKKRFFSRK